MSSDIQPYILDELDAVIDQTVANIGLYTKNPGYFTRNRKLNATTTTKVTLNMQGNSLNAELLDAFPSLDERMTASAYEQAKGKLKPEIFEHILKEYNQTMRKPKLLDGKYRVFAIDGSDFTTPYNIKSDFVRIYQDCILQPKSSANERDAAIDILKRLDCGKYIVIMDRGYDGFNMIETCNRLPNCHYIIRTKAGKFGGIREIANLPDRECDVEMTFRVTTSNHYYTQHHNTDEPDLHLVNHRKRQYKDVRSKNTKDQRWDFEQFVNVKCRVVKFRINNSDTGREEWEVLLTNLNRFEFPISRMKEMYHRRWDIETSFRELKYALGGINFHSKKDDFIKMELFAHFIMFNAVSRSIACVSVPQNNHKYPYAIDFKMACLIVRKYYRLYNEKPPNMMFTEILAYTVPVRAGRSDKRNLKPKSAVWFVYRVA